MKNKNTAAVLALVMGIFGVHRFYLNRPVQGVLYCLLFWTGISAVLGLIDAVLFATMDARDFDFKYNRSYFEEEEGRRGSQRADYGRRQRQKPDYWQPEHKQRPPYKVNKTTVGTPKKENLRKASGIKKYKNFDFPGAIDDFQHSLRAEPNDVPTYFNLACAYSLTEQKDAAFFHLSEAVRLGFADFEKINTHDGMAFLRIQSEFDGFVANGYRIIDSTKTDSEPPAAQNDLLEQLQKAKELHENGILSHEEFALETKRILS